MKRQHIIAISIITGMYFGNLLGSFLSNKLIEHFCQDEDLQVPEVNADGILENTSMRSMQSSNASLMMTEASSSSATKLCQQTAYSLYAPMFIGGVIGCWLAFVSYGYYHSENRNLWLYLYNDCRIKPADEALKYFTASFMMAAVLETLFFLGLYAFTGKAEASSIVQSFVVLCGLVIGHACLTIYKKQNISHHSGIQPAQCVSQAALLLSTASPSAANIAGSAMRAPRHVSEDVVDEIRRLQSENMAMIVEIKASLARQKAANQASLLSRAPARNRNYDLTSDDTTPSEFICPITQEIMLEPVIANDGIRYERTALQRWYDFGNSYCPIDRTKSLFRPDSLPIDLALHARINEYLESRSTRTRASQHNLC